MTDVSPTPTQPRRRTRLWQAAIVGIMGVTLAVIVAFFALHPKTSPEGLPQDPGWTGAYHTIPDQMQPDGVVLVAGGITAAMRPSHDELQTQPGAIAGVPHGEYMEFRVSPGTYAVCGNLGCDRTITVTAGYHTNFDAVPYPWTGLSQ